MSPEAPDGSIVISPKEFYDGVKGDVSDIKQSIHELSTTVGTLPARVDKLEIQLAALHSRVIWASGFAAAVGLASGYIIPQLMK